MLRYGTAAEQKYIDGFKENFDALLINGNMLAFAGNAISRAVTDVALDYIVDPLTHGFQHDLELLKNEKGDLKVSIQKMIIEYGDFIAEIISSGHVITPDDFKNDKSIINFVESVINFQKDYVQRTAQTKDYYKYLEYAGIELTPKWLVIPYFCMNARTYREWLNINLKLIQLAKEIFPHRNSYPLAAQIVIEKDILEDPDIIKQIIKGYQKASISPIMLWVDDFSAFECSQSILSNFVSMITNLSGEGISVYNLYGDYFSILLCHPEYKNGLSGVCHGLEYGEKRAVIPVGGGIPINKFYYPPLHQRLPYREATTLLLKVDGILGVSKEPERFYKEICDCPQCHETIGNDIDQFRFYGEANPTIIKGRYGDVTRQFPTQGAKNICIRHFLYSKLTEWSDITKHPLDILIQDLIKAGSRYSKVLGYNNEATFKIWEKVLLK
jgi:hypothetical protein